MTSHLYRTQAIFQLPRYVPILIARAQASQTTPTPGQGVPMSGSTKTVSQTGGTKKGASSTLPSSSTPADHTNPTKTSSDAPSLSDSPNASKKQGQDGFTTRTTTTGSSGQGSSTSYGDAAKAQSFMSSPAGKYGAIAVLAIGLYAGYKMMSGGGDKDPKDSKDPKNSKDAKDSKDAEQNKKPPADNKEDNAKGNDKKK